MLRFSFILVSTFSILSSCASSKYVNYLKQNTETVAASDSLHFTHLDDQFFQNNLFLVGEIHDISTGRCFSTGRFAEKCSFQSDYLYAANNPVGFIDANGDSTEKPSTQKKTKSNYI